MGKIDQIVKELVPELEEELGLDRRKISSAVTLSAYRKFAWVNFVRFFYFITKPFPKISFFKGIDFKSVKAIEVIEGKAIPKYRIEILKDMIRKAALKKLARLEDEQAQKIKERKN
jgi:hypothetical protein